ncbi:hypothetical protein CFP65_0607 [Kitasatospora sp. MMS16-BH015]|uniref:hypothetical protein n=1 Tax=Kitasatospora sp. MMS16-BH015 TaxID=2018025 RepID=UPI000CA160C1|nr:hypothetical protein [Kitasatospora sp. MMS16-BH015]AUG75564.1 hypothetical protein CFP65_0607 [Kitasatospora sp. MMS16-BH015]
MPTTASRSRRHLAAALLLTAAATTLTACGDVRTTGAGTPAPSTSLSTSTSASPRPVGASPYVEPGAGDGAPHNGDNLAYRRAREMSPESAPDAQREADRIKPVLERLRDQHKWDPDSVRTALVEQLGYRTESTAANGNRSEGPLIVKAFPPYLSPQSTDYTYPEGADIGLRVHDDACVTASTGPTRVVVEITGPFPENGCFQPPYGH